MNGRISVTMAAFYMVLAFGALDLVWFRFALPVLLSAPSTLLLLAGIAGTGVAAALHVEAARGLLFLHRAQQRALPEKKES